MIYYLDKKLLKTIYYRLDYLKDIFGKDLSLGKSFEIKGCSDLNVVFIVGHFDFSKRMLEKLKVRNSYVVIISCTKLDKKELLKNINTGNNKYYIAYQDDFKTSELALLVKGNQFGFKFDLTKSEIDFYNKCRYFDIITAIDKSFSIVKHN